MSGLNGVPGNKDWTNLNGGGPSQCKGRGGNLNGKGETLNGKVGC